MLDTHDVARVGTRRILACPSCLRLQDIVLRPAIFAIACKDCHQRFRVTETGAVAQVEAARFDPPVAPGRSPGAGLRAMSRSLRSAGRLTGLPGPVLERT